MIGGKNMANSTQNKKNNKNKVIKSDPLKKIERIAYLNSLKYKNISDEEKANIKELVYKCIYNCPTSEGPQSSLKYLDYDIGSYRSNLLLNTIKYELNIKETNFKHYPSKPKLEEEFEDILNVIHSCDSPVLFFVVYAKKDSRPVLDGIYSRLRNAFAHGCFVKISDESDIENNKYLIWDSSKNRKNILSIASIMILTFKDINTIYNSLLKTQEKIRKQR